MDKGHPPAGCIGAWRFIDQRNRVIFQAHQRLVQVVNLEANMVEPRSSFGQVLGYPGLLIKRGQEFDLAFPDG